MSDSDLILSLQASEDARNEEYRSIAFQTMLEKLESLGSIEDGFQFVCEASEKGYTPDWIKSVISNRRCKPSFLKGASEALAII